jgi:hypothetical protein
MAYEELFKELLKAKRLNMGAGNRKKTKTFSTTKVWLYPTQWERAYFKEISKLQKSFLDPLTQYVRDNVDDWVQEYKVDSSIKRDSYLDNYLTLENTIKAHFRMVRRVENKEKFDGFTEDYQNMLEQEEAAVEETYVDNAAQIIAFITFIGNNTADFNDTQVQKFMKQALGVNWNVPEPWLQEVIDAWALNNYDLIKSLTNEGIKRVNTIVSNGVQMGQSTSDIMKEIRKSNKNITKARSALIARDQIGKLNGMLSKRRMQEAGLNWYIWQTVLDERVRGNPSGKYPKAVPSHYIMEGKLCKWGDNTVYSDDDGKTWKNRTGKMPIAIPGQEIQCRCTQLPYMDNIIEQVDNEINEELAA